jgi:hypothetical protein
MAGFVTMDIQKAVIVVLKKVKIPVIAYASTPALLNVILAMHNMVIVVKRTSRINMDT